MVFLVIMWGYSWITSKIGLDYASPLDFATVRVLLGIVFLFLFLLWSRASLRPRHFRWVVFIGIVQTSAFIILNTWALSEGEPGKTSVLVFTMPFWTMLVAWPVLHERVRGIRWFAVAFALFGLVFVVEPWRWEGDIAAKLWAVLSGFGWAAGSVATKYYQRRYRLDALSFLGWQMLVGVLPLTPLPWLMGLEPAQWGAAYAATLFWTAAVSTAIGFLMWNAILRILPAGTASLNTFAIPVVALVSSMIVFGERLTASEWIGIGFIGAGLTLLTLQALGESRRDRARARAAEVARADAS